MNFRRELAWEIRKKYLEAATDLISKRVNQEAFSGGGCVVIALDGLMRGELPSGTYNSNLRARAEGKVFTDIGVVNMALEFTKRLGDSLGDGRQPDVGAGFYSSSPTATGKADLPAQRLSREDALKLARDIRNGKTLGVLLLRKVRGRNHLLSLIGDGGAILRVDGAIRPIVTNLTNREAANLLRRGQRHGLVIDIR